MVYQDAQVVAFRDVNPQAPVHVLVIPRRHVTGFSDASAEDAVLLGHICLIAARVAAEDGIDQTGYRCVVNSGEDAGQTVHHLHMHVMGRRRLGWPPG